MRTRLIGRNLRTLNQVGQALKVRWSLTGRPRRSKVRSPMTSSMASPAANIAAISLTNNGERNVSSMSCHQRMSRAALMTAPHAEGNPACGARHSADCSLRLPFLQCMRRNAAACIEYRKVAIGMKIQLWCQHTHRSVPHRHQRISECRLYTDVSEQRLNHTVCAAARVSSLFSCVSSACARISVTAAGRVPSS